MGWIGVGVEGGVCCVIDVRGGVGGVGGRVAGRVWGGLVRGGLLVGGHFGVETVEEWFVVMFVGEFPGPVSIHMSRRGLWEGMGLLRVALLAGGEVDGVHRVSSLRGCAVKISFCEVVRGAIYEFCELRGWVSKAHGCAVAVAWELGLIQRQQNGLCAAVGGVEMLTNLCRLSKNA